MGTGTGTAAGPNLYQASVGNTALMAAVAANPARIGLTIQNNQTSGDNCWVEVTGLVAAGNTLSTSVTTGNGTTTAQQASILLTPSSSYQRYFPYLPRGPIVVTCATAGDSIYVDTQ